MSAVTQAVVLVGGRGTRLGELTLTIPKPMMPIRGRPFLEYLVEILISSGFNQVLFCTSYLAGHIQRHFGKGKRFGITADYSHETHPLGTGGALWLARGKLDNQFLVVNGDTIFDIPLRQVTGLLARHPAALAAMALRHVPDGGRYGSVQEEGEFVTEFGEKKGDGPGLINGGVYCLTRKAVDLLPAGESSLERNLFPRLVANRQLCAAAFDGYFLDIGLPDTLERAERELPKIRVREEHRK
jgi:D-glycero-D-manno-heptose 1,7-bisphosphate phosphatase